MDTHHLHNITKLKEKSTDCDYSMHSLYTILSYPQRKEKIIEGLKIFVTLCAFASLLNFFKRLV